MEIALVMYGMEIQGIADGLGIEVDDGGWTLHMKRLGPSDDGPEPWAKVYDWIFESLSSRLWRFMLLGQSELQARDANVERLSFLVITSND